MFLGNSYINNKSKIKGGTAKIFALWEYWVLSFFIFKEVKMSKLEASLILYIILFIIIFLIDYLFIKRKYLKILNGKSKKKKRVKELTEIVYLIGKFKLEKDKLPINKILIISSLINAFIISLVSVIVMLININVTLQLIIGFILLISLIYSLYEILGMYLVKKGYGK